MLASTLLAPELATGELLGPRFGSIDPVTYRLGTPGRNPRCPYLHLFVPDNSWSVMGGNDTAGRRFDEMWQAVKTVARCSNERTAVALVPFDQPSVGTVPPGRLDDHRHLERLRANLRIPPDSIGSSELGPALMLVEHYVATTAAKKTLTVVTDFELLDDNRSAIYERLRAFPGQVFAVVLGRSAPANLVGDNISVIEIGAGGPPGTLATAIWNSLTTGRPGRSRGSVELDVRQPTVSPEDRTPANSLP